MLVLDENLPAGQRSLLRKWRIRFRVVGAEIAASGTLDPNLIPILHRHAGGVAGGVGQASRLSPASSHWLTKR